MNPKCENCEIEIRWQPTVVDGRAYCCLGCSEGGPCECDYAHLPALDMPSARVIRAVRFQIVYTP